MRWIVDICRVRGDYQVRLLRLHSAGWNERVESIPSTQLLCNRLRTLGITGTRLEAALMNLPMEDRIVWFDCNVPDDVFAAFGIQHVAWSLAAAAES